MKSPSLSLWSVAFENGFPGGALQNKFFLKSTPLLLLKVWIESKGGACLDLKETGFVCCTRLFFRLPSQPVPSLLATINSPLSPRLASTVRSMMVGQVPGADGRLPIRSRCGRVTTDFIYLFIYTPPTTTHRALLLLQRPKTKPEPKINITGD